MASRKPELSAEIISLGKIVLPYFQRAGDSVGPCRACTT